MALVVKRTGAEEYGRTAKMLLAGAAGAGKTRLASTFPNPFYANVEGGLMSVADRAVPYIDVNSSDDLNGLLVALRQPPKARENILGAPVSTIIIDTLDALQKVLIEERKRSEKKEAMAIADWGWLGDQLRLIVRNYRNLDLNVIFTCHVKTQEDGETGQTFVAPALQGAMGDEIAAYVDVAGLLRAAPINTVKDGKQVRVLQRLLQTSPDARHTWLKDRSGALPMEYEVNLATDGKNLLRMIYGIPHIQPSEAVAEVTTPQVAVTEAVPPAASVTAPPKRGRPAGTATKTKAPAPVPVVASVGMVDSNGSTEGSTIVTNQPEAPEVPSRDAEQVIAEATTVVDEALPAVVDTPADLEVGTETSERELTVPEEMAGEAPDATPEEPEEEETSALSIVPEPVEVDEDNMICSKCGKRIESEDYRDLSLIRFRQPLCRDDFVAMKAAKK